MAIDSLCRLVSQPAVSSSAAAWGGAGVFRRPQALPKTERNARAAYATTSLSAQPVSSMAVSRMVTGNVAAATPIAGGACTAASPLPTSAITTAGHMQPPVTVACHPDLTPARASAVRSDVVTASYSGVAPLPRESVPGDLSKTLRGISAAMTSAYPIPARQPSAVVLHPPSSSAEGAGALLSLAAAALQPSPSPECSGSPTWGSRPPVIMTTATTASRPRLPPAWVALPQGAASVPTTYGALGNGSRSATAGVPTGQAGVATCSAPISARAATTAPAPIAGTTLGGVTAALLPQGGASTSGAVAAGGVAAPAGAAVASSPSSPPTVQRQSTHATWRWQSPKNVPSAQSTSAPGSSGGSSSSNSSPGAAVMVVTDPLPSSTVVHTVARMMTMAPADAGSAPAVKVAVSTDAQDSSRQSGSVVRQRPPRLRPMNEPEPADVPLPDPEESQRRWKATPQDGSSGKTLKILCYGDSLTAGYVCWDETSGKAVEEVGVLPKFTPYGAALHEGLQARGFAIELVSVGLHGVTARQMVKDAGSALGLETKLKEEQFDLVLIMAGSNDIYFGGTRELLQHIRDLHGMCHKRGVRTVALAPPYPDDDTWRQDAKEEAKAELAAWVKTTPQVLTYVDPESEISREADRHLWEPSEYLPLHLTSAGYVALGQRLLPHIVPLLSSLSYSLPARM